MPSYLQKRVHRWYAVLEIPKGLRPRFGKPRFIQSLETDSRTIAERRVSPIVTAWKKDIARARGEPVDEDAAYWRRTLRNGTFGRPLERPQESQGVAEWIRGRGGAAQ